MTIDRAIHILQLSSRSIGVIPDQDLVDAAKLGIEALKRLRAERGLHLPTSVLWLPGETEE